MFRDRLSLYVFYDMALPGQVMDIVDNSMLSEEIYEKSSNVIDQVEDCLSTLMRIGVACSSASLKLS